MISDNLRTLRKLNHYTQEQLAEQLGVSRQAIAKWESGETLPDLKNCMVLAAIYHVTLDDLVQYEAEETLPIPPKGKYLFGKAIIDEERRIQLPEKALEVFHLEAGSELLMLGDEEQGIALVEKETFMKNMGEFYHVLQEEKHP